MEDGRWKIARAGFVPSSTLYLSFSRGESVSPLTGYLILSAFLFAIGLAGALTRRNAIIVLIGIELMLNAANLNFIAFWRFSEHPEALTGIMFVIFSIGVAAAEAAVGLALIIAIYRHYRTTNVDEVNSLNG
jgi:NADH-quinone oxidoreductase subunit K